MHELAATENLLRVVLDEAAKAKARKVTRISLQVGEWSSFVPDCIQFYLGIIAEGTPAEGASLEWETVPTRFECRECGATFGAGDGPIACPACAATRARLISGREFSIVSIEVDGEDPGST
ncbi:MAG: hydrogenase maturation nickel metallochaperone HypA [Fimbriimonadia bacterium]|jgi:hydrogenase nickel incorporation protein HypA/HybF